MVSCRPVAIFWPESVDRLLDLYCQRRQRPCSSDGRGQAARQDFGPGPPRYGRGEFLKCFFGGGGNLRFVGACPERDSEGPSGSGTGSRRAPLTWGVFAGQPTFHARVSVSLDTLARVSNDHAAWQSVSPSGKGFPEPPAPMT